MTPFHFRKAVLERISREREERMEAPGKTLPVVRLEANDAAAAERARLARAYQLQRGDETRRRVLALRDAGHSMAVIREMTGYSLSTVKRVFREARQCSR